MRLIREVPLMLGMGLGLVAASPVLAQSALSAGGFTGWSVTPTAKVLSWGTVSLAYDNELVGGPVTQQYGTSGDNMVVGFGLLPHLEVSGRIASSTLNTNCFTVGCGIRDLSFNAKAGVALDRNGLWNVAAGATDIGGQTGNFNSVYGVVTYSPAPLDLSLGYARRTNAGLSLSTTHLSGVFGSVAYRSFSWLQTHVEYADGNAWAGARIFAPADWMPQGWTAFIGVNARVRGGDDRTARSWFSTGVTIPLYKVSQVHAGSAPVSERVNAPIPNASFNEAPLPAASQAISDSLPAPAVAIEPVNPTTDDQLRALAEALKLKGFEDISVGRATDSSIAVRVNNASYNVNTLDGLGAALGVIARHLSAQRAGYRLVLTQRQIAIVAMTGHADCLADWINEAPFRCTAGDLYTPGTTVLDDLLTGSVWTVGGMAPSWKTPRLILQPGLRSAVATDYGVFDYSLALRATLQQPLWAGAWAEVSGTAPLADSQDFKAGQPYGSQRYTSQMDQYMVHQIFRVPFEKLLGGASNDKSEAAFGAAAVTAHVAVGQIDANYRGAYGEIRWEPTDGLHRINFEGGQFDRIQKYYTNLPSRSRLALASYRYAFMPMHTYFEVTAGQFLYNDRGAKVEIKQWFDDVSVSLYVRRSKFDFDASSRTSAGIEVSIPLTPRRDMSPSNLVQVTGAPQWTHTVETLVSSFNYVSWNQGVIPNISALDRTFNFDRSSSTYFEDNMQRVRSAASSF
jgi:hypothetical protein